MTTCDSLKDLTNNRIYTAKMLYKRGDYVGVVDNIGFGLELALKALICKRLKLKHYPDQIGVANGTPQYNAHREIANFFRTHDFVILGLLAGISSAFTPGPNTSPALNKNWGDITANWSPDVRYNSPSTYDQIIAQRIIDAAINRADGVITFIKRRW